MFLSLALLVVRTAHCFYHHLKQSMMQLVRQYKNTLGEGSHDTVVTTLSNYSYICQAVGSKDMYRSVSLAVKFKASDKSYDQYQKLQMQGYCDGMIKVWDSLNFNTNFDDAIFSIPLHINCKSCLDEWQRS